MNMGNAKPIKDIVAAFKERFRSEDVCREILFQYKWPDGFCCPQCGYEKCYFVTTRSLYECKDCRAQTSLTAGTMMHNTNLPLQYWFLVIHLSAEGIIFSARWLSKTLRINYRSAHRMMHAVRRTMRSQNGFHLLSHFLKTKTDPESQASRLPADPDKVIQRAKRKMLKKIDQFIRAVYRSVHLDFKQNYIDEFYFQWKNRIGDRDQLSHKLMGACTFKY